MRTLPFCDLIAVISLFFGFDFKWLGISTAFLKAPSKPSYRFHLCAWSPFYSRCLTYQILMYFSCYLSTDDQFLMILIFMALGKCWSWFLCVISQLLTFLGYLTCHGIFAHIFFKCENKILFKSVCRNGYLYWDDIWGTCADYAIHRIYLKGLFRVEFTSEEGSAFLLPRMDANSLD